MDLNYDQISDGVEREAPTRYNQPGTVAVVFDPDGGEHPCYDVTDERYDRSPRFWCAGMVMGSVEDLVNRLWAAWDEPCEPVREWDERRAMEARVP